MGRNIVIKNGRIWCSANAARMSWMVIDADTGYITHIGDGDVPDMGSCDVIDVGGKLVLPGFHESHIHVSSLGKVLSGANLETCTTVSQVLTTIRNFAASHPKAAFIVAYNLNDVVVGRLPSRLELDEISPNTPVLVYRVCCHIAVINSPFFKLLGIQFHNYNL